MRYYYIPIRKAKIWTLATTNIAENMEQQALWFTAGENIKWYSHENSLETMSPNSSHFKIKYRTHRFGMRAFPCNRMATKTSLLSREKFGLFSPEPSSYYCIKLHSRGAICFSITLSPASRATSRTIMVTQIKCVEWTNLYK